MTWLCNSWQQCGSCWSGESYHDICGNLCSRRLCDMSGTDILKWLHRRMLVKYRIYIDLKRKDGYCTSCIAWRFVRVEFREITHIYSAFPIAHGHFFSNNSRKTAITRPLGRGMGVYREFEIWSKFCLLSCCTVVNILLYCTAIYRESRVHETDASSLVQIR